MRREAQHTTSYALTCLLVRLPFVASSAYVQEGERGAIFCFFGEVVERKEIESVLKE